MVVGEVASPTDVLVIGGGPGGYAAALRCAAHGLKTTLIERDRIGGTCLNVGCIPSKALIHAAEILSQSTAASSWGIDISATLDMERLRAHVSSVVEGLTSGIGSLLEAAGVECLRGEARFSREDRVAVESGDAVRHFEFRHAIVATGSRPLGLASLPFDGHRVLDSSAAVSLDRRPETLAIVGAGYIGVELGIAFAKLGSSVSIVESMDRVLPSMDSRFGRLVARRMLELGIDLRLSSGAVGLGSEGLEIDTGGGRVALPAEKIVVAIGRRPNTDSLGLERTGVELDDRGLIVVDPSRRASRHVLAIGDVTEGPALAHKATAEAEVAARTAAGLPAAFEPACIAQIVFSDPEIATVGSTVEEAEIDGYEVVTGRFPFAASGRARTLSSGEGFVEVVAEKGSGAVLGVHMIGTGVSELAGEAALAVEMGTTLEDLALTIHAHPTLSEGLPEAAWTALGRGLHVRSPG